MKLSKFREDIIYLFFIFLTSILTVADLFLNVGKSANGDGLIHTVVPTLFAKALLQGNFPVGWTDGFANYGLPLGTVSQQITTYLSAFITVISHNPVLGFNVVVFLGVLLSAIFFYVFLRIYFLPIYSFVGVFLFNFAPYRILNIYIRGALPEFFAGVFFPLLLISAHLIIVKKNIYGLLLFIASISLLALTHPFMLIVSMFLLVPYVLFLLASNSYKFTKIIKFSIIFFTAILFGILITSYYILPLVLEIKYFYYGQTTNHLTPNNFLGIQNFLFYSYPYFTKLDILNRGFVINVGGVDTFIFICGLIYFIYRIISKKIFTLNPMPQSSDRKVMGSGFAKISVLDFAVVSGLLFVFMMTSPSNFLYSHISFLSNIQFSWRMLSGFNYISPIILVFILEKIKLNKILILGIFTIICVLSFIQLYGKNYTNYPYSFYTFTPYNLDAVVMNTIWTGESQNYPIKPKQWEIIEGQGKVTQNTILDNSRSYTVNASTRIRMVDHTFYFPGWKVYIDGAPTTIEYQNMNYRGVITYLVPPGSHTVVVKYTDTKVRLVGKLASILFILCFIALFFFRNKLYNLIYE